VRNHSIGDNKGTLDCEWHQHLEVEHIACQFTPLPESEDMMGKPKPQDSFRLLLVEVLNRGKFFKNKEEVAKPDSVCKVKF
jgi:hypothetical protein